MTFEKMIRHIEREMFEPEAREYNHALNDVITYLHALSDEEKASKPEVVDKEISLSELADRKGKFVFNAEKRIDGKRCSYYYISNTIIDTKITRGELFDTEKQARQYLNGLENKK